MNMDFIKTNNIKLLLVLLNFLNNSFGSRLPLEVYEIPSSALTSASLRIYNNNNHNNNNNNSNNNSNINFNSNKNSYNNSKLNNNNNSNYVEVPINLSSNPERASRQINASTKLLPQQRILYQVGESENDLPVCVPNAVCSKIDLYETPWIERQCRCPEISHNYKPHYSQHNHRHQPNIEDNLLLFENSYHNQHYKNLKEEKIEDIHLSQFMKKYHIVHKEDLALDDESEINENSQEHDSKSYKQFQRNELPSRKHYREPSNKKREFNKLRHSGHYNEAVALKKNITFIGGCPSGISKNDGHTISDKTRLYKLCNPVHKLPLCNSFRDYTWTLSTSPEMNVTEQIVHCRCRPNSVTYLTKWEPIGLGRTGFTYLFACSPKSKLRCQRKEPCKLFTVRKRQEFLDEVNTNPLCQCPKGHKCPKHHTDSGVIPGKIFIEDNIQTYSGYCMTNV